MLVLSVVIDTVFSWFAADLVCWLVVDDSVWWLCRLCVCVAWFLVFGFVSVNNVGMGFFTCPGLWFLFVLIVDL